MKKDSYLDLFLTFARIGGFTFGGGLAMLPMLEKEVVAKKGWATQEDLLDYYAIAQCTPGIIAVNVATFVGYKRRGILGGIIATLGVVAPSIVIILIIAAFLKMFIGNEYVAYALAGIRVAVAALVLNAIWKLSKSSIKDAVGIILFLAAFIIAIIFSPSPIWFVVAAIAIGIIYSLLRSKKLGGRT